jgi:murein DD-endopeptidase MepM/ murein hydrolase activator NlpD
MRLQSVVFAALICAGCRNPIQAIHVMPAHPRQGDTVQIAVKGGGLNDRYQVVIGTRAYPMFSAGAGERETLIGIDAQHSTGSFDMRFQFAGGHRTLARYELTISSRAFPSENVTIPENKTKLTQEPDYETSEEKLLAALATVSPDRLWEGNFELPAAGRRTTVYGMTRTINKTMAWPYHRGWDIAAPRGTPVKAANRGRVVLAERSPVEGRAVVLDHGQGVLTIYMHLSAFAVTPGMLVEKGQRLGDMGSDGFSTGPHVHWGVYVFGAPVDPAEWTSQVW